MLEIAVISYGAGALLFLALMLLLLTAWPGRAQGAVLVAACGTSALWAAVAALHAGLDFPPYRYVEAVEFGRDAAWLMFLLGILRHRQGREPRGPGLHLRLVGRLVMYVCALMAALLLGAPYLSNGAPWLYSPALFVYLLLAVTGLALVEQLYRNTRPEHRWAIKFLCVALGTIFAYDFYLYSHALLFRNVDPELWGARGAVNAIVVPLIAVAAARNPQWSVEIFVSRHVVFHSVAVLGAGIYLMLMAAAGYYIRLYGGTWGGVAEIVFLFGAVVLLLALLSSGQLRAKSKVFLSKHFFRNKYDYREEWLRFTHTLSTSRDDGELRGNIIRAVADIIESPGGVMWIERDGRRFLPVASWNVALPEKTKPAAAPSLVRFLERTGWVIYLDELSEQPERYPALDMTDFTAIARPWIVVPLMCREDLVGFIVLSRSQTKKHLNWEDTDLLKTVGREAGTYLAVLKLTESLADARQFEAFNRLSAYVVHDLKNLVAQLSLVVKNARRYQHNPEFLRDAIQTVENATGKMNRLLEQLRKDRREGAAERRVAMEAVLRQVVQACSSAQPVPLLECDDGEAISVRAEVDRLAAVLEHIVRNAQEATPANGSVTIRLRRNDEWALLEVQDTGSGMDGQFISERLFRPFETTKGNAGMGIGAYESREYIREHGGDVEVESEPGKGTIFRIRLPAIGRAESTSTSDSGARVFS
jgi:putative PEP-CTERM system histidine kinase